MALNSPILKDSISNIKLSGEKNIHSEYLRPIRLTFSRNGKQRIWDLMESHESAVIFLFNVTRQKVIFVRQFRPAVYYTLAQKHVNPQTGEFDLQAAPPVLGYTIELCAGILDKPGLSAAQTAVEEVLEECGYRVDAGPESETGFSYGPTDPVFCSRSGPGVSPTCINSGPHVFPPLGHLIKLLSYPAGLGVTATSQTLYYCLVTDAMLVGEGGGNAFEEEQLDVLHVDWEDALRLAFDERVNRSGTLFGVFLFFEKYVLQYARSLAGTGAASSSATSSSH